MKSRVAPDVPTFVSDNLDDAIRDALVELEKARLTQAEAEEFLKDSIFAVWSIWEWEGDRE